MSAYTTIIDTISRAGATLGEASGAAAELRATFAERAAGELGAAINGLHPFTDVDQLRPIAAAAQRDLGTALTAINRSLEPVVVTVSEPVAASAAGSGATQLATETTVTKVLGPSEELVRGVIGITERSKTNLREMLVRMKDLGTDLAAHRAALVDEHETAMAFRNEYAPRVTTMFEELGDAAGDDPDFLNLVGAVNDNKARLDALQRALDAQKADIASWQGVMRQLFG